MVLNILLDMNLLDIRVFYLINVKLYSAKLFFINNIYNCIIIFHNIIVYYTNQQLY